MGSDNPNLARIFCIGQNYIEHIKELSNPMPEKPVVFMRPLSCLVTPGTEVHFPRHGSELHYEVEVVVRIGRQGQNIKEAEALSYIDAITLGVDLTLRDLQKDAKQKGLPWDAAKAFEQSAPLGEFLAYDPVTINLKDLGFICMINGEIRQNGNTRDMLFGFERLLADLSKIWILKPGDMIYTGTPSGVGPLQIGDSIEVENDQIGSFGWSIVE